VTFHPFNSVVKISKNIKFRPETIQDKLQEFKMKRILCTLMIATMLMSSTANAGILILTGDIGNKFNGYKVVGILTIVLTGVSIVGLVVDGDDQVDSKIQIPELSEASLSIIDNATSEIRTAAVATNSSVVTTIAPELAQQIVSLEGLDGSPEGLLLFNTLTTK
jgi:hypothetical protein